KKGQLNERREDPAGRRPGAGLHAEDHRAQRNQFEGLPREERCDPVLPARLDAWLIDVHARLRQAHPRFRGGEYPGTGYQHGQPLQPRELGQGGRHLALSTTLRCPPIGRQGLRRALVRLERQRASDLHRRQAGSRPLHRAVRPWRAARPGQDPRRGDEAFLEILSPMPSGYRSRVPGGFGGDGSVPIMADYVLERRVWLPRPRREVFAFSAAPSNLSLVPPPSGGLRWLKPPPPTLAAGAILDFSTRVVGLPV